MKHNSHSWNFVAFLFTDNRRQNTHRQRFYYHQHFQLSWLRVQSFHCMRNSFLRFCTCVSCWQRNKLLQEEAYETPITGHWRNNDTHQVMIRPQEVKVRIWISGHDITSLFMVGSRAKNDHALCPSLLVEPKACTSVTTLTSGLRQLVALDKSKQRFSCRYRLTKYILLAAYPVILQVLSCLLYIGLSLK